MGLLATYGGTRRRNKNYRGEMKIAKEKIRIKHNEYNRFWKPIGMFSNIAEIKIANEWYKCSLKFIEKELKNYVQL